MQFLSSTLPINYNCDLPQHSIGCGNQLFFGRRVCKISDSNVANCLFSRSKNGFIVSTFTELLSVSNAGTLEASKPIRDKLPFFPIPLKGKLAGFQAGQMMILDDQNLKIIDSIEISGHLATLVRPIIRATEGVFVIDDEQTTVRAYDFEPQLMERWRVSLPKGAGVQIIDFEGVTLLVYGSTVASIDKQGRPDILATYESSIRRALKASSTSLFLHKGSDYGHCELFNIFKRKIERRLDLSQNLKNTPVMLSSGDEWLGFACELSEERLSYNHNPRFPVGVFDAEGVCIFKNTFKYPIRSINRDAHNLIFVESGLFDLRFLKYTSKGMHRLDFFTPRGEAKGKIQVEEHIQSQIAITAQMELAFFSDGHLYIYRDLAESSLQLLKGHRDPNSVLSKIPREIIGQIVSFFAATRS